MAEEESSSVESIAEKVMDSGHEKPAEGSGFDEIKSKAANEASSKSNSKRLFGRERPVHNVLGGGKSADIFLWRNKKTSAIVLGGAAIVWLLFEVFELHLLTFVCHSCIVALAVLFLWSNAASLIHKSPPRIPEVTIPENTVLQAAAAIRREINQGVAVLRDIASGSDLKKFLTVIACLWVLSIVGSWCNFLTLLFLVVILAHTVPVFYEKYDDKVDAYIEKGMAEAKKQYSIFDEKVFSKIPKGPLKSKKKD